MSALVPTASSAIPSSERGLFTVRSVLPLGANADTLTVTIPAGFPKDALPIGPANVFTLATDTYTRDADIAQVTTHDRSTGATVYAVAGDVTAGAFLVQTYCIVGAA